MVLVYPHNDNNSHLYVLGENMYVCLCHGVTDTQIRDAVMDGATRLRDVAQQLGVATDCGRCACCAHQLIKETLTELTAEAHSPFREVA
ncbi:bacterioferritin-associated ferredoxin [Pseudogulbenkiania ferrooxidans]|uniref:Bacterioferritin-associated ferredoxin n=1 Tax=Pseudogulbenkiania ferrooxidans 2002 TaxID=279714 RepID=B9Z701_9NEIS|nr:bacterioferritin-associated ferredoxin [Pseudogulbenkiania ferrooxidans]EEG07316.1 BFD domain protein (2Fe-2S)-binding domain protein [Pseudogulbenkiania ferrooxidans 2002]